MERIDEYDSVQLLRRANERFSRFFARFSGAPVLGTVEEVEALLQIENTLQSVRPYLDGRLQNNQTAQVRDEIARYRANLVRLHNELRAMHISTSFCIPAT